VGGKPRDPRTKTYSRVGWINADEKSVKQLVSATSGDPIWGYLFDTEIALWLKRGKENGATHVIIVCDTFDYDDYPVYVQPNESAREIADEYNKKSMQRVMEVYSLSLSIESQLAEHRAFHYD
jgi:hypothetical protein